MLIINYSAIILIRSSFVNNFFTFIVNFFIDYIDHTIHIQESCRKRLYFTVSLTTICPEQKSFFPEAGYHISQQKESDPMRKRRKFHEIEIENDIRYRGPLSYQGFQILGWLCISLMVVIMCLNLSMMLDPASAESTYGTVQVLTYFNTLSLPFLLISNFARILNASEGYRMQLIRNGGGALAIFLVTVLFFSRYVVSLIAQFVTDPENVVPVLTGFFREKLQEGFIAFNIFVDLFLCTLFMYFLNARPKRFFTGKKTIIFRLFALLPVAYEVFSIVMKGKAAAGDITLPLWSFPLLTVKPPMTFVVFMTLALLIKTRELRFCKHGRTHEEYQAFLKTNRNSLHFSVYLSVILVISAILDFIILVFVTIYSADSLEAVTDVETVSNLLSVSAAMGFGKSIPLLFVAPVVLLFSYTRTPKYKPLSTLVPIFAISLMVLMVIEAIYQGLSQFAIQVPPLSIRDLFKDLSSYLPAAGEP